MERMVDDLNLNYYKAILSLQIDLELSKNNYNLIQ